MTDALDACMQAGTGEEGPAPTVDPLAVAEGGGGGGGPAGGGECFKCGQSGTAPQDPCLL